MIAAIVSGVRFLGASVVLTHTCHLYVCKYVVSCFFSTMMPEMGLELIKTCCKKLVVKRCKFCYQPAGHIVTGNLRL